MTGRCDKHGVRRNQPQAQRVLFFSFFKNLLVDSRIESLCQILRVAREFDYDNAGQTRVLAAANADGPCSYQAERAHIVRHLVY